MGPMVKRLRLWWALGAVIAALWGCSLTEKPADREDKDAGGNTEKSWQEEMKDPKEYGSDGAGENPENFSEKNTEKGITAEKGEKQEKDNAYNLSEKKDKRGMQELPGEPE